jgi:hypothetical protein
LNHLANVFAKALSDGSFQRKVLIKKFKEKMKKLSFLVSALLLTIAFSCNDQGNLTKNSEIKVDERGINAFINYLDFNVNQLTASGFNDFGNQEALTKFVNGNQAAFEKKYGSFALRDRNDARTTTDQLQYITSKDGEVAEKLLTFSKNSVTKDDYLSNLANLRTEIYSYDLTAGEKQILLTRVVIMERLVKYMDDKVATSFSTKNVNNKANAKTDPTKTAPECTGWWSCWGKCVAGTVGGAITGGLGGCAISAVPTAGFGCPVGAVVGAIGGGLTGAAASCD